MGLAAKRLVPRQSLAVLVMVGISVSVVMPFWSWWIDRHREVV